MSAPPDARFARPPISAGRKLTFVVIVLVVLLVVLEGAVRARAWQRYGNGQPAIVDGLLVPHPATGLMVPKPGYEQRSDRIWIKINSLGFRGDEITAAKPPRTVRIATVGASTTFCGEVSSNGATWPHQLQEILQKAHPEVTIEVINAGVPGYTASESFKNLEARVLPLQPDLVIYYEANNDMARDARELAQQQGLLSQADAPFIRGLAARSLLFDLARKNWRILWASRMSTAKLTALPPDMPARYTGELDKMRVLLADRDVRFVLSTFFVKYRRDQPRETQVQNASVSFYYMPWLTIDGMLDGMDLYNNAIVDFGKRHGVPVVNDRTSIPGDSLHFADWAHFADAGARMMGQRFASFLEEQGLIQPLVAAAR